MVNLAMQQASPDRGLGVYRQARIRTTAAAAFVLLIPFAVFYFLLKEAVHELGHTMALTHCDDYTCAMAPSHAVEWIDLKDPQLCEICHGRALG